MKKKLSQNRGETLVEVLAAVLIASLAITLLFGGIMASVNLNRSAKTSDETFYADLSAAERQTDDEDKVSSIIVTVKDSDGNGPELTVTVYGGEAVRSYAKVSSP